MKYKYQGYDGAAKRVDGELEAKSETEARTMLRARKIRPIRLVGAKGANTAKVSGAPGGLAASLFGGGSGKPSLLEFTAFIRQFATMQSAGIPIVQGLNVLGEQVENRAFGKVLTQVARAIEEGTGLTDALRRHPLVFDKIFLNLVAAGEVSGALDKVLSRLAIFYEKSAALRRKIVSAATYPTLIIVLVVGVVMVLLTFVVPTFAKMFTEGGKPLPAATLVVLNASNFVRSNIIVIMGILGGGVWGVFTAFKTPEVRQVIDPYLLNIPIFGDLLRKIAIARFARTMGTMIQSGVPILDALEITSNVAGNYAVESAVRQTKQSISEGNSISTPLAKAGVFPKMAISMISIGEQTGALEAMLTKIAEFYEDEVDAKVGALSSILEPLMIVIVGCVVAGVLIPMYLPIFSMADAMGGG
jgi:type IV pilus assembly protein PilC